MLRMVKTENRQWNREKARLMTAIFMILYHGCLPIGEAVVPEGNLENMLKRSQVKVVRVGRSGHDAVLRIHTFKHNKSQKQVSIQVKGQCKGLPSMLHRGVSGLAGLRESRGESTGVCLE